MAQKVSFFPKEKVNADLCLIGVTRKLLGLTFHGSTRDEHVILCDMQLDVKNLDRNVCTYLFPYTQRNLGNQPIFPFSTVLALLWPNAR